MYSKDEYKRVLEEAGDDLVVLDCFATWCGPCKQIAPKVVEMSKKHEKAHFYKIDVDELAELAAELGVRAMPTFFLFKGGEKVAEVVGANERELGDLILKHV